jgi:hypothetical protein
MTEEEYRKVYVQMMSEQYNQWCRIFIEEFEPEPTPGLPGESNPKGIDDSQS